MGLTDFAKRLCLLADTLKLEHQVLARDAGVSKATFSNYVHGEKFPRLETLANWVVKYGVSADWLLTGHGNMFLNGTSAEPLVVQPSDDAVISRMNRAVQLLKQANASDEVIQNAILASLNHQPPAS